MHHTDQTGPLAAFASMSGKRSMPKVVGFLSTNLSRPSLLRPSFFRPNLFRPSLLSACVLSVALCLTLSSAFAADDTDAPKPPPDRTLRNLISNALGGKIGVDSETDGDDKKSSKEIDYRERSPLVVPRSLDLPPPESGGTADPANWPRDPGARKAAADPKKTKRAAVTQQPGTSELPDNGSSAIRFTPSQLGFNSGSNWLDMFNSNPTEVGQFKGEPNRESLTQPPAGYQVPSPDYAYGIGPAKPDGKKPGNFEGVNPLGSKN
jgi:hypothetical protein